MFVWVEIKIEFEIAFYLAKHLNILGRSVCVGG